MKKKNNAKRVINQIELNLIDRKIISYFRLIVDLLFFAKDAKKNETKR